MTLSERLSKDYTMEEAALREVKRVQPVRKGNVADSERHEQWLNCSRPSESAPSRATEKGKCVEKRVERSHKHAWRRRAQSRPGR